ncbi:MAG: hypothetical protein RL756_291, partial [Pseudomonadota bacterium]
MPVLVALIVLVAIGALAFWWRADDGDVASQPTPANTASVSETKPSTPAPLVTPAADDVSGAGT